MLGFGLSSLTGCSKKQNEANNTQNTLAPGHTAPGATATVRMALTPSGIWPGVKTVLESHA